MRLDTEVARRLFAASRVARLATVDATGVPHLVPVTFAFDGEDVVTAVDAKPKSTTSLRRLDNITVNPDVALLADYYDDDWTRLWWVRLDGTATVTERDAAAVAALTAKYEPYADAPPTGPVVRVLVTTWRGWSASPAPPVPAPADGRPE